MTAEKLNIKIILVGIGGSSAKAFGYPPKVQDSSPAAGDLSKQTKDLF